MPANSILSTCSKWMPRHPLEWIDTALDVGSFLFTPNAVEIII